LGTRRDRLPARLATTVQVTRSLRLPNFLRYSAPIEPFILAIEKLRRLDWAATGSKRLVATPKGRGDPFTGESTLFHFSVDRPMIPFIIQRSLVSLYLLTTTCMAGWTGSSMSWSPDGEWLGYTVVADPGRDDHRTAGWLFDTASGGNALRGTRGVGERKAVDAQPAYQYQIWASHRNHKDSVLIEETRWPLTAVSWSPRGKSMAFGRFVPQSMEPNQPGQRGRFEVVIQDAINRKRLLWASSDFELDDETRARFPQLGGTWSPDGRYLAFSRPSREPSILIVGTDSGKVLATLEHATQPAWSPDGSRCAFIRTKNDSNRLCVVERHGQTFAPSRPFLETGSVRATPGWSSDSVWIFVVAEKSTTRLRELELVPISAATGDSGRVLPLIAEPALRGGSLRGVAIDFDRDGERCFFSVDIEGRDSDLGVGIIRDQHIPRRFPLIDASLRIGALAVSPNDRYLAIRFGPPDSLTPPALYDLALEQTTLIVPDETSRRQWLNTLIDACRSLLISGLPQVTVDGHLGERPTLLPLPGELPASEAIKLRLSRIARLASPLCDQASPHGDERERPLANPLATEARLFFAYLRDDFPAATSDLDTLAPQITSPDDRLSLLNLRAQVLWSQGEQNRARAIIDYLVMVGGTYTKRVEETPSGLTETVEATPKQVWTRYLSARAAEGAATQSHPRLDLPSEMIDIPLPNPFAAPEPLQIERGAGNARFAPIFQGVARERD
jgi:Tol biopolymer transport system component